MKFKILFFALLLPLVSCKKEEEKKEEKREIATYTIEQFMDNESVFGGSFSPDNSKLLVTSNRSGIFNMYTVPSTGGDFTALTSSDSASVFAISYFPEDERILFRMDDNGDEIYKLFVMDGDSITRVTPAKDARALFYGWSQDGKSFYYGSNQRDSRYTDVYRMNTMTFTPELIYENSDAYEFGGISPDGNFIALGKALNTNDSDLFLYNFRDKSLTQVNTSQSGNYPQDFSKDNKFLYYTTDAAGEFAALMKYDLENKTSEEVMKKKWDIVGMGFSDKGTYRVTYVNEDAANKVEV
ncbi:MAG TPA: hypothetical protein VLN72_06070, partial [Gillisia sp.]|nr:hypothetical protein [Gillisia sp.]